MLRFWLSLTAAALGPLQFGYHLAELNAPEGALRCPEDGGLAVPSLPDCIPMNAADFGFVSSIFAVGGLVGALSASSVSDKYGRFRTQLLTTIPFIIGSILGTTSVSKAHLAAGRFITGFAAGSAAVVVPLYIHEISDENQRAKLGATTQVAVNSGILITQILGLFWSDPTHWRWILAFGGLIATVQLIGLFFSVESPKWLHANGFPRKAEAVERRLRGGKNNSFVNHEEAEDSEEHGLLRRNEGPNEEAVSIWEFIRNPSFRRELVVVVGIMAVQQLTGINAVIMYGVSVLKDMMPGAAALINVFISLMNVVITASAAPLFDRLGRKPCLILSITGMGISAFFVGLGVMLNVGILTAIATITFVASFSMGLGPLPWTVASEIVVFRAVGAAQSMALAANWTGTFLVAYLYPVVASWIGKGAAFWIFSVVALFALSFITVYLPETKGAANPEEVWARWDLARSPEFIPTPPPTRASSRRVD